MENVRLRSYSKQCKCGRQVRVLYLNDSVRCECGGMVVIPEERRKELYADHLFYEKLAEEIGEKY